MSLFIYSLIYNLIAMTGKQNSPSASGIIILILVLLSAIAMKSGYISNEKWYWVLIVTLPLLLLAILNIRQKKHALLRNFPVLGYLRYFFESIRPEIRQYFFESDLDGKPFNRRQRSIVYQRAKNEKQTVAFGMQTDPNKVGFEWAAHSLYPVSLGEKDLRVWIGNYTCKQPYHASIYNIGAMSFGALSKTAITALNEGAKLGGFAHNTGEGGISEYHLKGGDLIWQIGTAYFGCRNGKGRFDPLAFRKNALRPQVKMIELKLSQGAKPGHGGVLPALKNTPEIAVIRQVKAGTTIHSPAKHAEFDTPEGLIQFLQLLRELSDGKPVGIKICIGDKQEFIDICHAIKSFGFIPDFITVDGGEGGTGGVQAGDGPVATGHRLGERLFDLLVTQHVLVVLERCLGPLDVDVLGQLGDVGQDRHLGRAAAHLDEPTVHGDVLDRPVGLEHPRVVLDQRGQERSVPCLERDLAATHGAGDHHVGLAGVEHLLR